MEVNMAIWTQGGIKKVGFAIKRPDDMPTIIYPFIFVKVGEKGYWEASEAEAEEELPEGVAEAALAGSMFGWMCPAAQPAVEYARSLLNYKCCVRQ
jgi:hypothetical protein